MQKSFLRLMLISIIILVSVLATNPIMAQEPTVVLTDTSTNGPSDSSVTPTWNPPSNALLLDYLAWRAQLYADMADACKALCVPLTLYIQLADKAKRPADLSCLDRIPLRDYLARLNGRLPDSLRVALPPSRIVTNDCFVIASRSVSDDYGTSYTVLVFSAADTAYSWVAMVKYYQLYDSYNYTLRYPDPFTGRSDDPPLELWYHINHPAITTERASTH